MKENGSQSEGKVFGIKVSTLVFLALLAATGLVQWLLAKTNSVFAWLLTLLLMAVVVISAGKNIKHLFFGFLIDERNRYSLSRLQLILWTLVVLSGYITAVSINLHYGASEPLAIAVPQELWVLMGISVTSLLGSPLLLNQRRDSDPGQVDGGGGGVASASPKLAPKKDIDGNAVRLDGEVVEKEDPEKAQWSDLFKGETANNFRYLDISRIQMFYFTFILVVAYGFALGRMFSGYADNDQAFGNTIESLPVVSSGMVVLLGISHTAYLGYKSVPSRRKPENESN